MRHTITYPQAIKSTQDARSVSSIDNFTISFLLSCMFDRQKDQVLDDLIRYQSEGLIPLSGSLTPRLGPADDEGGRLLFFPIEAFGLWAAYREGYLYICPIGKDDPLEFLDWDNICDLPAFPEQDFYEEVCRAMDVESLELGGSPSKILGVILVDILSGSVPLGFRQVVELVEEEIGSRIQVSRIESAIDSLTKAGVLAKTEDEAGNYLWHVEG